MRAELLLEAPSTDGEHGARVHICSNWPEGEKNSRSETEWNQMSDRVESGESIFFF